MTTKLNNLKAGLLSVLASVVVATMFVAAATGPALTSTVA
jgi:hypothetical protein